MAEFDRKKCAQRNRIAARRDGVDAVPLRLFREGLVTPDPDSAVRYAVGKLPTTMDEALSLINATLPDGATALVADDVYIHYLEAASGAFIADRGMFLSESTLRNIAQDAATGIAFMNSHADGALSHPAELPMGKTFAGRHEQLRDGTLRTRLAFYMLRGVQPNGAQGPSTDDLHRMIVGGTATDVSVGLHGGDRICDVCGNNLADSDLCTHSPGTHHNLTADQRKAQEARGVPKGRASYTLDDAHMHEVSAVYDGAVPGAGFRKTLALARRHQLSRADLVEASQAYARLLQQGDLPVEAIDEIGDLIETHTGNALTRFFERFQPKAAPREEDDVVTSMIGADPQNNRVDLSAERHRLEQERADLDRERQTLAREKYWAQAERDVDSLITAGKILPAQDQPNAEGQRTYVAFAAQLLADDATATALFGQAGGSRYATWLAAMQASTPQVALGENLPVVTLSTGPDKAPVDEAARDAELLSKSSVGQLALARQQKERSTHAYHGN